MINETPGARLATPSGKPLRGLYPILETPFTADDVLDTQALAAEVRFINRGKVAGMIWPVFASGWSTLSDAERTLGAETILAAGRGGSAAIAIAVQNNEWDTDTSVRHAKHAAAHGADAIVSIPPHNGWNVSDQTVLDYYQAIGAATTLPLIVQTRGTMSVDLMIEMFHSIPTMKATKDEVGDPLARVGELLHRTDGKLARVGRRRRHGKSALARDAAWHRRAVPHAATRRLAATGDGSILGRQQDRRLRHVRPGTSVRHHSRRARLLDDRARRIPGERQAP